MRFVSSPVLALTLFGILFGILLTALTPNVGLADDADPVVHDLVIYGGTSAAITTAVQAKNMGKSVVIVCPEQHLGGLTSGGLGWTDSGNKAAIGGLSREFYHQVWQHYQDPQAWRWQPQSEFGNRNQSPAMPGGDGATMWVFEPHVAEQIFERWVAQYQIPVERDQWLNRDVDPVTGKSLGVEVHDGRIASIEMISGKRFRGKMFVDATYEGDLMAAAGVQYHVGREANSQYDEQYNGVQVGTLHHGHWFKKPIDPYVQPGDPSSGLLPRISSEPPGTKGESDHRVQAYCYRMCLTNHDENRIPFAKPAGYDPYQYELLLRVFDSGWQEVFEKFDSIPNYKTDTNNHGPFSTDNIGMNYDYPEASYERREEILREHEEYQRGLMYFLANDPRVPDDIREKMARWGLAKDEFQDNGGWPHQLYVREARRMVGDYVMTEHDCLDRKETPESIGMGSYTLDSHNVQRYVKPDGYVQNEGDIGVSTPAPYEIALGAILPKADQCKNLLVPVCVSSSHIAFGSIRMEPVFMILGQSAATVACLALDHNIAVQDVPYAAIQTRLLADGQVLEYQPSYEVNSGDLGGTVVDDSKATFVGEWSSSSVNRKYVDRGYHHDQQDKSQAKSASFETALNPGHYEVRMSYPPNQNRATNVTVSIDHASGTEMTTINQRQTPTIDGLFTSLGQFQFGDVGRVTIQTRGCDGYVVVDAVQFLPVKPGSIER